MGRLADKIAVITGGASGIGAASARLFVEEGCKVVIADLQDEKGAALAAALGPRASYRHADVSIEADVQALIEHALQRHGRLDCLFNNAGVGEPMGSIEDIPLEAYERAMGVLLRGVFVGIKHAAPAMKRQGSGSIVNTASVAGLLAGFGSHVYSAAKAAVIQLTRSVAMELGESGVRVNCICPGAILTPIFGRGVGLSAEAADLALDKLEAALAKAQPLARCGRPEDVARAALWLASDDASFVNGEALVVDGGLTGGRMWSDLLHRRAMLRSLLGVEPQEVAR